MHPRGLWHLFLRGPGFKPQSAWLSRIITCDMAMTPAPRAIPPQHLWDPKKRVHISRWHYKREDAHVGSFSMIVGYFLTIFSSICSYCEFPLLYHYLLWLQPFMLWILSCGPLPCKLWVLIWVYFRKTYWFGKPELQQAAAGASRGINNTKKSKHSTVKACFNFLVAENFSLCVPATPCSTTSTSRLTPLKGEEI